MRHVVGQPEQRLPDPADLIHEGGDSVWNRNSRGRPELPSVVDRRRQSPIISRALRRVHQLRRRQDPPARRTPTHIIRRRYSTTRTNQAHDAPSIVMVLLAPTRRRRPTTQLLPPPDDVVRPSTSAPNTTLSPPPNVSDRHDDTWYPYLVGAQELPRKLERQFLGLLAPKLRLLLVLADSFPQP
jgi:hypothetical protein